MASNMFNFSNARAAMNPSPAPITPAYVPPKSTNNMFSQPFSKYTGSVTGDEMISLLGRFGQALNPKNAFGRAGAAAADFGDQKRAIREKIAANKRTQDRAVELAKIRDKAAMDRTKTTEAGADRRTGARLKSDETRTDKNIRGRSDAATKQFGRDKTKAETQHGYKMKEIAAEKDSKVALAKIKNKKKIEQDVLKYVDSQMNGWYESRPFGAPEPTQQEITNKRQEFRARRIMENAGFEVGIYQGQIVYRDPSTKAAYDKFGNPIQGPDPKTIGPDPNMQMMDPAGPMM